MMLVRSVSVRFWLSHADTYVLHSLVLFPFASFLYSAHICTNFSVAFHLLVLIIILSLFNLTLSFHVDFVDGACFHAGAVHDPAHVFVVQFDVPLFHVVVLANDICIPTHQNRRIRNVRKTERIYKNYNYFL